MRRSLHLNLAGAIALVILLGAVPGAESPVADAAMKGDKKT